MYQWNKIFKEEGKVFVKIQEDIPKVLKLLKKHKVKRILDLGFGSGRHIIYFSRKGFDVYGIDISKEGLKITKSWLKKEKLKANLRIGSIYDKLPYPNNFFDAVISIQTIHHSRIETLRKAIKEMERVLKPKGIIFITVPKRKSARFRTKSKKIAPRTYIPIEGKEKGLLHYLYNKKLLRKDFKNFKIYSIWTDSRGHYCLLGKLKII
jgi:ubiquinone/menaquinone biosynthesis C-methylase UbiE